MALASNISVLKYQCCIEDHLYSTVDNSSQSKLMGRLLNFSHMHFNKRNQSVSNKSVKLLLAFNFLSARSLLSAVDKSYIIKFSYVSLRVELLSLLSCFPKERFCTYRLAAECRSSALSWNCSSFRFSASVCSSWTLQLHRSPCSWVQSQKWIYSLTIALEHLFYSWALICQVVALWSLC